MGDKTASEKKSEETIRGGFGLFNLVSNTIEKLIASDDTSSSANVSYKSENLKKKASNPQIQKEETKEPEAYYDPVIKQWIINGKPPDEVPQKIEQKEDLAPPPFLGAKKNDIGMPVKAKVEVSNEVINQEEGIQKAGVPGGAGKELNNPFGNMAVAPGKGNQVNTGKRVLQNRYVSNFWKVSE